MKIADIRGMRPDELQGKLEELESHVFDLRAQAVTEKLENSNCHKECPAGYRPAQDSNERTSN